MIASSTAARYSSSAFAVCVPSATLSFDKADFERQWGEDDQQHYCIATLLNTLKAAEVKPYAPRAAPAAPRPVASPHPGHALPGAPPGEPRRP